MKVMDVEGCVSVGEANSGSKRKKEKVNVRNVRNFRKYARVIPL